MGFLIVKCKPLNDGWECDADRTPIKIVKGITKKHQKYGYEIYEIDKNGFIGKCIQGYEDFN